MPHLPLEVSETVRKKRYYGNSREDGRYLLRLLPIAFLIYLGANLLGRLPFVVGVVLALPVLSVIFLKREKNLLWTLLSIAAVLVSVPSIIAGVSFAARLLRREAQTIDNALLVMSIFLAF